jgi:hypothetical protein
MTIHGTTVHGTIIDGRTAYGTTIHGTIIHGRTIHGSTIHGTTIHGTIIHGGTAHGRTIHGRTAHGRTIHGHRVFNPFDKDHLVTSHLLYHRRKINVGDWNKRKVLNWSWDGADFSSFYDSSSADSVDDYLRQSCLCGKY